MTSLGRTIALLGIWAAISTGCSTYRSDLDRAAAHYNDNEYEHALALLEVLERDRDSLSTQEQARYAYFRGMTHFRLGDRRDARHWLGVAAALDEDNDGALAEEETKRVDDTMADLNREVYGGSTGAGAAEKTCKSDDDCGKGRFCDNGRCRDAPDAAGKSGDEPTDGPRGSGKSCGADVQCPGDEVCINGRCFAP